MSRRGRPKNTNISLDFGTVELRQKRECFATMEAIDLCLYRGLISKEQHKYAVKLRWLYTLRFGTPYIKSHEFLEFSGRHTSKHMDENSLRAKQMWYQEATQALEAGNCRRIVMDVCVFNIYPTFLTNPQSQFAHAELEQFQGGLTIITSLFKSYYDGTVH